MALLDKYNKNTSTLAGSKSPSIPVGATAQSKLHDEYSLNGNPKLKNKPSPSILDLNGATPKNNYRNTAPEGRSF
jgi:hypothetical protein